MKLVLRACAAPLRPSHLAYFLKDAKGSGMSLDDAPYLEKDYHDVAMEAMRIQIVDDVDFAHATRNLVYKAINKPIAKLNERNQFLAIAPKLELAGILVDSSRRIIRGDGLQAAIVKDGAKDVFAEAMEEALGDLMPRPFVMGFDLHKRLDRARIAGGEAISPSRLQGFVEQHLGTACVFTYDA